MAEPSRLPSERFAPEAQELIFGILTKPISLLIAFLVALAIYALNPSQSHLKGLPFVNPPKSLLYIAEAKVSLCC